MKQFKVELLSIDRTNEIKNIQFITFVEADDKDGAIYKAKGIQKKDRSDINPSDTWLWHAYETAEKRS